jgi:hypothetical protein
MSRPERPPGILEEHSECCANRHGRRVAVQITATDRSGAIEDETGDALHSFTGPDRVMPGLRRTVKLASPQDE